MCVLSINYNWSQLLSNVRVFSAVKLQFSIEANEVNDISSILCGLDFAPTWQHQWSSKRTNEMVELVEHHFIVAKEDVVHVSILILKSTREWVRG